MIEFLYEEVPDLAIGKLIANNKKAYHDYFIEETFEAGMVLTGTEVKSLRAGKGTIKESYAEVTREGEIWINNMHISPFDQGNRYNVDPLRRRKLLLHKREINKIIGIIALQGLTLVPTKLYFNEKGKVKLELAVAKGKKLYDKRQSIAKKDAERRMDKEIGKRY